MVNYSTDSNKIKDKIKGITTNILNEAEQRQDIQPGSEWKAPWKEYLHLPPKWVHSISATTEKALPLAECFWGSLGVNAWRTLASEDLVGQADDIGDSHSERSQNMKGFSCEC